MRNICTELRQLRKLIHAVMNINYDCSLHLSGLLHLLEQAPELLQGDLAVPVRVELGHQLLQLLLAHVAAPELAQLTRINRPGVVLVNCLREYHVVFSAFHFS